MVNRSDSERLRGFCDRQTDRRMDICDSRVAVATENSIISLFFSRCEITSSNYEITEKYQQMTVIGNFKSKTLIQFS